VKKDAEKAFSAKDLRFLDVAGHDAALGIEGWNKQLKKKYDTRAIGDSFA